MMGSLPNLHELERIERKKEKRRERKVREEMAKNIKLEKNKLFQLKKVSDKSVTRVYIHCCIPNITPKYFKCLTTTFQLEGTF